VTFSASPRELFNIYLDSKKHGVAIDGKVSVSRKARSRFSAFGGTLRGRTLMIVPDQSIVQPWQASSWKKNDTDSVLDLQFDRVKNGGRTGSCRSMFLRMPTLISMEGGPSIPGNPGKTI